ncbi:plastocyanin/azurin family copper-binding protein [Geodermatophilus sp. DSM 44513]|uniref:plastocyanin/azurin family copper-binding protein n=1 Tax=Geodermatophilus sp. DSM 44513 TaxID=1528104 RepID=UPI00126C3908|nr:plastocyanin/azurin family copper-binding protein [Geodermatophilus sp. DSM 44513]WNV74259.1 plastocyanin/azurin family copper-binding protein [Geodermatophilus sp. DSM 44513]
MSHPTGPTRSARRAAALVLVAGAVLVSGCSADQGTAGEGTAEAPASSEAPMSSAAPSSSAEAGTPAPSSAAESPAEAEAQTVAASLGEMYIELGGEVATPGTYTFEVVNDGQLPHNLIVERDGEDVTGTEVLQAGESATLEVTLEDGDYVFYCSVGSHRAQGMETPVSIGA